MVIQLDNGEVINIYKIEEIRDYVDDELYKFILDQGNTLDLANLERIHELEVELEDAHTEMNCIQESLDSTKSIIDDIIDDIDDLSTEEVINRLKNAISYN